MVPAHARREGEAGRWLGAPAACNRRLISLVDGNGTGWSEGEHARGPSSMLPPTRAGGQLSPAAAPHPCRGPEACCVVLLRSERPRSWGGVIRGSTVVHHGTQLGAGSREGRARAATVEAARQAYCTLTSGRGGQYRASLVVQREQCLSSRAQGRAAQRVGGCGGRLLLLQVWLALSGSNRCCTDGSDGVYTFRRENSAGLGGCSVSAPALLIATCGKGGRQGMATVSWPDGQRCRQHNASTTACGLRTSGHPQKLPFPHHHPPLLSLG